VPVSPVRASRKVYTDTSSDALLDKPPPIGTLVTTTALNPTTAPKGQTIHVNFRYLEE
jgi:hypothetical protein